MKLLTWETISVVSVVLGPEQGPFPRSDVSANLIKKSSKEGSFVKLDTQKTIKNSNVCFDEKENLLMFYMNPKFDRFFESRFLDMSLLSLLLKRHLFCPKYDVRIVLFTS